MTSKAHRKRVRHFEGHGHLRELTFSCYRRKPLLTNDRWRGILAQELQKACELERFGLTAFVFMPEHVHLLVIPKEPDAKVSRLLARTKQWTSKRIKAELVAHDSSLVDDLTVRERPGKCCFRFWQEGPGFDRNVFSARAIEASIHYIHTNPTKRGLCRKNVDWKWSSARLYEDRTIDPDLPYVSAADPSWFDYSGVQSEYG